MSEVGFPGFEKLEMFKDTTELGIVLNFIIQVSNLVSLDRTGKRE